MPISARIAFALPLFWFGFMIYKISLESASDWRDTRVSTLLMGVSGMLVGAGLATLGVIILID